MKRQKMRLRLVKSTKMDQEHEHSFVRMPRAARKHFCPEGDDLVIKIGSETFVLGHKQAYITDIKKIGDERKYNVGFVSTQTYNMVNKARSGNNYAWLSEWVSETIEDLVIGSDPEFGLVDDKGLYIYARHVYDKQTAKFGSDGPWMEIRADQAADIGKHAENIKKLIEFGTTVKKVAEYRWYTGATYKSNQQQRRYEIGGHIHIGNPSICQNTVVKQDMHIIQRRIARLLDELVGLPLTRIDFPQAAWRRKNGNDVAFGGWRPQTNRFEWRTPSAIWLTHPDLAVSVLGTVKAVAEEAYQAMLAKKFDKTWVAGGPETDSFLKQQKCFQDNVVRTKINNSTMDCLSKQELENISSRLRCLSTYTKYKPHIDEFIRTTSMKKEEAKKINLFGMKENWLAGGNLIV